MTKVAVAQAAPFFFDGEATTEKVCALVKEAGANGASLILFPETFIPSYPDWVWRVPAWEDGRFTRLLLANAVTVPGPGTFTAYRRKSGIFRSCNNRPPLA